MQMVCAYIRCGVMSLVAVLFCRIMLMMDSAASSLVLSRVTANWEYEFVFHVIVCDPVDFQTAPASGEVICMAYQFMFRGIIDTI